MTESSSSNSPVSKKKKVVQKAVLATEEAIVYALVALQAAFYTAGIFAFYQLGIYFNHATIVCK